VSAPAYDPPLTACPLCRSTAIRDFDHDMRGAVIARCDECGVKFMNPQYTDAYLAELYGGYADEPTSGPRWARRRAQKERNLSLIEQYVRPGRFLSVGCGDGVELRVAKERGWSVEGFDVDPKRTAKAAAATGATIYAGDLFSLPMPDESFDCVYLDQVLEHPKRPADYLRFCERVLRPNGVLFLGVPNIESVSSTFKTALGKAGMRRRRRGRHYDSWHHQFYFAPATLVPLLERRFGFRVLAVHGDPKPSPHPDVLSRLREGLSRGMPNLDSSFVVVALKRAQPA